MAHIIEASGFLGVEVGDDIEHGTGIISFRSRRDGVERDVRIDWNLLTSAEYRQLAGNAYGLEAVAAKRFAVRKVEEAGSKKEAAARRRHGARVPRRGDGEALRRRRRRASRSSATRASER